MLSSCSSLQRLRVDNGSGEILKLNNRHNKHLVEVEAWDATNRVYLWHLTAVAQPVAFGVDSRAAMPDSISLGVIPKDMVQVFPQHGRVPSFPPMGTKIVYRLHYLTEHPFTGFAQEVVFHAVSREGGRAKCVRLLPIDKTSPAWMSQEERDSFIAAIAKEVRDQTPFFLDVATNGVGTDADRQTVRALIDFVGIENPYQAYQELRAADSIELYGGTRNGVRDSRRLTSVRPLASFTNLRSLVLADNRLRDITPLESLINLEFLRIDSNLVEDITPLKSLVNLEFLRIDGNLVEDIAPIMEISRLRVLNVSGNPILRRENLQELRAKGVNVIDYRKRGVSE